MEWLQPLHPYIAVGTTISVFVALQLRRGAPTDLLFVLALMLVTLTGVITPKQAFSGFANPAPLTIAGLLIVAAGLRSSGVLDWLGTKLLGAARTEAQALRRLAFAIVPASAVMLNTALVAMMMPVVIDWCRRHRISTSRLLMPVSYMAILGGVCTVIGTSTTLVVNGLLREEQKKQRVAVAGESADKRWSDDFLRQARPMSLFELGAVGLPCALAGASFLLVFGRRLLPNRTDIVEQFGEQRREYLVEVLVQPQCGLIGKTIERAGLRHLPGLFLIEIDRVGEIITPVNPQDAVQEGDRLIFTGVVDTIVDLERIPGLVPAADSTYELDPERRGRRRLTEVVLSRTSPLIGTTVREANFRQLYNAAVVAVHRNGARLTNKIGNILLEPGDTLLLQTRDKFVRTYQNHRDFYLVSPVQGAEPRRHHKMPWAAALAGLLLVWLIVASWWREVLPEGFTSPAVAALTIAGALIISRCLRMSEARAALDLQMLVTIIAALGLGRALTESNAASGIASFLVEQIGPHPHLLLILIYLLAIVFTETITNNAVAAMLLPIALAVAAKGGFNPRPYVMAITLAASLSFVTPIGYQTNLMVMGPGGYRAGDYVRCGLPLAIIVTITALVLIPFIWPV